MKSSSTDWLKEIGPKWHDAALVPRPSRIDGTGLFAARDFRAGEIIIRWGGVLVRYEDYDEGRHVARATTAYDDQHYLTSLVGSPPTDDEFINHSCDANTYLLDEVTVATRRGIAKDEEVTTDFAQWADQDYTYTDNCACGAHSCRRLVTGRDWKIAEVQQRYGLHFLPFINEKILRLSMVWKWRQGDGPDGVMAHAFSSVLGSVSVCGSVNMDDGLWYKKSDIFPLSKICSSCQRGLNVSRSGSN